MKRLLLGFLVLGLALAGCQEKEPVQTVAGPKLVSCDPSDGARDLVGGSLTITMMFDRSIKCLPDEEAKISVDGEASIRDVTASTNKLEIGVLGLKPGETYTVTVPEGTVLGYSSNQKPAEEIRITFSMKHVDPYVPSECPTVIPSERSESRNLNNI